GGSHDATGGGGVGGVGPRVIGGAREHLADDARAGAAGLADEVRLVLVPGGEAGGGVWGADLVAGRPLGVAPAGRAADDDGDQVVEPGVPVAVHGDAEPGVPQVHRDGHAAVGGLLGDDVDAIRGRLGIGVDRTAFGQVGGPDPHVGDALGPQTV